MSSKVAGGSLKGRGSLTNARSRFEAWRREVDVDPEGGEEGRNSIDTIVTLVPAKTIISTNNSKDIPFDASLNPYQGCEHGCIYCYARPSHAYVGLSPGLDFETKIMAKENAAALLQSTLSKSTYIPKPLVLGANTDPYQPIERRLQITRAVLEVLHAHSHPVAITTKSGLVTRDIDVLAEMAQKGLARVFVSVTSLANDISRTLEPRASSPVRRLQTIEKLTAAGIPVGVLVAPVIPAITDVDLEKILEAASSAGATMAAYILLRLPNEVQELFDEWLEAHYPLRKGHVLSLLRQMRGGELYDPRYGHRMRGTGVFADLLSARFKLACKKNGLNTERHELRTDLFERREQTSQLPLF